LPEHMKAETPLPSTIVPPYFTSRLRLCLLLAGNLCIAAISFVLGRHSFWLALLLLAVGCVCTYSAHGSFRGTRPSRCQRVLFFGGLAAVVVIAGITDYEALALTRWWLPRNPIFLLVAFFSASVDLLKLKDRNG
jgi:hypothetical protein